MNIWRLNVRETQITSCINNKKFAFDNKPRNPEIQKNDILLLQLTKVDAAKSGKEDKRIVYALIFDHYIEDYDGAISKAYWPKAGKVWRWILDCSDIIITVPFSLEKLKLEHNYFGQTNPLRISKADQIKIEPYILRCYDLGKIGLGVHNILMKEPSLREDNIWSVIQNNDRIVEASPDQIKWVTKPPSKEIKRNPELPCVLKELYNFKCQICQYDFKPDYGQAYSETHHIIWLSRGGVDHSNNLMVICPNHHRIIHETRPRFDRQKLAFVYPNGLKETLELTNHFKDPALYNKIELWAQNREDTISKELNLKDYGEESED